MKTERRYIDFMQDIVDNLLEDEKTRYSVICALEIVGEASKRVPTAVRRRNPQVPWKEMAGMRDRLIHGYFGVDDEIVWKTAREFAPDVRSAIVSMIELERSRSTGKH